MSTLLPLLFQATGQPTDGRRSLMITLWYAVMLGLIFYFFFIRPQRKQQKAHEAMIAQLKKGDEVVTTGGVIGEVVHLKDDRVTIKSGDTRLVVLRSRIGRVGVAEPPAGGPPAS